MAVERGAIFETFQGYPRRGVGRTPRRPICIQQIPLEGGPQAVRARDFKNRASEPQHPIFCDRVSKNGFSSDIV